MLAILEKAKTVLNHILPSVVYDACKATWVRTLHNTHQSVMVRSKTSNQQMGLNSHSPHQQNERQPKSAWNGQIWSIPNFERNVCNFQRSTQGIWKSENLARMARSLSSSALGDGGALVGDSSPISRKSSSQGSSWEEWAQMPMGGSNKQSGGQDVPIWWRRPQCRSSPSWTIKLHKLSVFEQY